MENETNKLFQEMQKTNRLLQLLLTRIYSEQFDDDSDDEIIPEPIDLLSENLITKYIG